jgi:hypothetical protein
MVRVNADVLLRVKRDGNGVEDERRGRQRNISSLI